MRHNLPLLQPTEPLPHALTRLRAPQRRCGWLVRVTAAAPHSALLLGGLMGVLLGWSSTSHAAPPLRVVTTIETFKALTQAVGGDAVQVESLARGYQDPHFLEPKPAYVVVLSRADLLVHVGLGLEAGWLPNLLLGSRNANIQGGQPGNLDASSAVEVLEAATGPVDRSLGDIHAAGNPHYWLPPMNAARVAQAISARLTALRPQQANYFQAQLQQFLTTLTQRAQQWREQAAPCRGLKVVTFHKSWPYVSQWLGLQEMGYIENKPGIPPDPQHLALLIKQMRAQGVAAILIESYYHRGTAQTVAELSGAKMLTMPADVGATPAINTYFALVDAVLAQLATVAPPATPPH